MDIDVLPRLYHEPVLFQSRKQYSHFIHDLHKRGLVNFGKVSLEDVTVFFVKEKNGKSV